MMTLGLVIVLVVLIVVNLRYEANLVDRFYEGLSQGAGKTWFITNYKKAKEENWSNSGVENLKRRRILYIPLYGLTEIAEVEDRLFQALHPILGSKPIAFGAKLVKSFLKGAVKIDLDDEGNLGGEINGEVPDLKLPKFLQNTDECILIFDDLERTKIPLSVILGYINTFVEHHGQKVIIIGYKQEIKDKSFLKSSEKTIGRTFKIRANMSEALEDFLKDFEESLLKEVLSKNIPTILNIYNKGDYQNLRTLKHSVLEFKRLFEMLPKKAQEHELFQEQCIEAFFSILIELKRGTINNSDVLKLTDLYNKNNLDRVLGKEKSEETQNAYTIMSKYFESIFDNIYPSEKVLFDFLEFGLVENNVLELTIDSNKYFINKNSPDWVKLWQFSYLKDEEFDSLVEVILKNIEANAYKKQGELRHLAGTLMYCLNNDMLKITEKKLKTIILNSIENQIKNETILPLSKEEKGFGRFDDGHGGFGFMASDTELFKKVDGLLRNYQKNVEEKEIEKQAPALLALVEKDSRKLFKHLTFSDEQKFAEIPILHLLPVDDFIEAFIKCPPDARKNITYLFQERYKYSNAQILFSKEAAWLKKLDQGLASKEKNVGSITKFQIKSLRKIGINNALSFFKSEPSKNKSVKKKSASIKS